MNRIYSLITLFVAMTFAACSEQPEFTSDDSGDRLRISTSIVAPTLISRVEMTPDGKGHFETGDRITLTATPDNSASKNFTLAFDGTEWTPQITWRETGDRRTSFSAFYPTVDNPSSETFVHTTPARQDADKACEQADLLHAFTTASPREEVGLAFRHLMSRIAITLSSDGSFSETELAEAEIRINARTTIEVNTATGRLGRLTGPTAQITPRRTGNRYEAVVCPQPVDEQWRNEAWMEIVIGGKTVAYKAPAQLTDGTPFEALESGKQIRIDITLKKKDEAPEWSNTTGWVYGINNPAVDTWKYTDVYPSMVKGLKWQPEYGWFDCNKMDPENHQNLDSQMCWAAASANSLYWWLAQNKDYIDRYGKYTGPNQYKSLDADIFRLYRTTFGNVGADVAAALDWFITGKFGMHYKEGAGFFREVFGEVHVSRITRFSERSLSEELKYAFTHKEVIECTLDYPGTLTHAVSLWGADFDEKGEVCAIYITDNNDRTLDEHDEFVDYKGREITPAGIIRKQVQKRGDTFYMEGSVAGQFTFPIIELNLLGLMEKEWQDYFAKQ